MATLAAGGRITIELVDEETERLRSQWCDSSSGVGATSPLHGMMTAEQIDRLDRFDRVQLEEVVRVCAKANSLSAAGRELFAVSRKAKKLANDADRLRKYLARFGLAWDDVRTSS
jgi:transcriptional regulatory protein RtcR